MVPPGRIAIENVNKPGRHVQVDADKYGAMKEAILAVLPLSAPGLSLEHLRSQVLPLLPEALFPGGAKAGWWLMAVQLDLRAKRQMACERTKPLRFYRDTNKQQSS